MADYRVTWDKKKENQLIDYFEAHPCLWDHSHTDYFRRDVRDTLMKELSTKLGCDRSGRLYTERHIKMRWKNIRTTYARECRKSENRTDDGSDYISKWAFIDRLAFIKDFIKSRAPYNCSNNFRLATVTAMTAADQSDVYQTLSDDDIDDDDLVVCLSDSFKEDGAGQKGNPQDMWESDDKKNIWITEGVSLANSSGDVKSDLDDSKTNSNLGEAWIVQERVSPQHRDWRIEERERTNGGSPSDMWRKDGRDGRTMSDLGSDSLHNDNNNSGGVGGGGGGGGGCGNTPGEMQVTANIAYMHNIKSPPSSEKAPPHGMVEEYEHNDSSPAVSLSETLSLNSKVCWTKDKETELIEFFEEHRFLWDHSHPDYFNRDLRDCIIRELSSKLGHDRNGQPYTDTFIRQRWKNLRTTFARELKKIDYHCKLNHGATYISRWAHTERLSFLKDCLKARGQLKIIPPLQNNIDTYSLSDDSDSITWSTEQFAEDNSPNFEQQQQQQHHQHQQQLSRTKRLPGMNSIELITDDSIGDGGGGGCGVSITLNGSLPSQQQQPHFASVPAKRRCRSNDRDDGGGGAGAGAAGVGSGGVFGIGGVGMGMGGGDVSGGGGAGSGGGGNDSKDDFFKEAWRIFNLKERHDPEDLFGMHVAGTLRRMQPLQREKAKLDIQGILLQHCFSKLEMSGGNGFGCSMKGFRRLTNTMYGTVGTGLTMTSRGLRPGFSSMIVSQFGNIQGRLVWSAGVTTAMSTIIVYDTLQRHAVFTVQIGIPNSFVSLSYTHKFQDDDARVRGAVRVGVFSTIVECGVEKKITEYSTLGATMLVGVPTGVTLRVKLSRGRQTFLFPIHLSDHLMPSAIFYGTAIPFMLYHAVKILIVKPYLQEQKKRDIEKKQEENSELIHKKKMEAESAVHLMQETVQRVIAEENEKSGLLIVKALYGKLSDKSQDGFVDGKYIDVAVPLQCLIKNSSLLIPEKNTKTGILGFYDPCLGEEKSLYIRYKFRNKLHHITLGDCEPLKIPLKKHIMKDSDSNGKSGKS